MSKVDQFARRGAQDFIKQHPLRDEFLDWMDEHEAVVDDLKLVVEEAAGDGNDTVRGATLIKKLRADFGDIVREEWAPLLTNLLVWEFPELRHHLKRELRRNISANTSGERGERVGSEPEERDTEGGEA